MCSEDLSESLMEKVGGSMVVLDLGPSFNIYMKAETFSAV